MSEQHHQTVATPADIDDWVREARPFADTTLPDARARALRDAAQQFYDSRKFSSAAMCLTVEEQQLIGDVLSAATAGADQITMGWREQLGARPQDAH